MSSPTLTLTLTSLSFQLPPSRFHSASANPNSLSFSWLSSLPSLTSTASRSSAIYPPNRSRSQVILISFHLLFLHLRSELTIHKIGTRSYYEILLGVVNYEISTFCILTLDLKKSVPIAKWLFVATCLGFFYSSCLDPKISR